MQKVLWTNSIPLGIVIIFAGIGVTYFIASGVVKPVEHLVRITDKVASGDLRQKVEIVSKDEIGVLASRFNKMTWNLSQHMDEKEEIMSKVKNLNRKLSLINAELRQKNEQLLYAQEQLLKKEKLAAVGALASGVNYELRNPLSAINNAIILLKKKLTGVKQPEIDEKVLQFLDIIDKETDRSFRIINELLGFTRVNKPVRTWSDIKIIVKDALSRVDIPENIKLIKDLKPNLPKVMIDTNQIGQVLINLIDNACQAMEEGGKLQISTRESLGFVTIEIGDSGCGISENNINKIFEPLFTTKPGGIGMGLAVCHGIIKKHNGTIEVKSQEGSGTNISVILPLGFTGTKPV